MKGRHLLMIVLGVLMSMACTFNTLLPAQAPTAAPTAEPLPTVARPQTAFIDGRTVNDSQAAMVDGQVQSGQAQNVQTQNLQVQAQNVQIQAQNVQIQAQNVQVQGQVQAQSGYSGNAGYTTYYGWGCTPRYDWTFAYVIQPGETLSNIAWRAGVSVNALAQGNCIANPNYIYAGQTLRLPCAISAPPPYYPPPHYPPPHYPPPHYPPPPYPTPQPYPTQAPPPPVVVGSGLSISPYDSVNNNTYILPPDQLITISWPATFPTATDRVVFQLIPPGGGTPQAIGLDANLADGASIIWNSVNGTQGTVQAVAYFQGGYAPQASDSYYIIAGAP